MTTRLFVGRLTPAIRATLVLLEVLCAGPKRSRSGRSDTRHRHGATRPRPKNKTPAIPHQPAGHRPPSGGGLQFFSLRRQPRETPSAPVFLAPRAPFDTRVPSPRHSGGWAR